MISFVHQLPANSIHLANIDLGNFRLDFNLNLGQRGCLRTIITKIQALAKTVSAPSQTIAAALSQTRSSSSSQSFTSQSAPNVLRNSLPDPVFDLANLQSIVNTKLSQGLKLRGYFVESFPVVASQTSSFPYSVTVECPSCEKYVSFQITADVRSTRKVINFRRHTFLEHFVKCVKQGEDEEGTDDDDN